MEFLVYNRATVEKMVTPRVPHAFISVRTPEDSEVNLPLGDTTVGVLRLAFHDTANEGKFIPFSWEMAREVLDFGEAMKGNAELIIVNCDAGLSRSQGVAAALSTTVFGQNNTEFFKRAQPNAMVYGRIVNTFAGYVD